MANSFASFFIAIVVLFAAVNGKPSEHLSYKLNTLIMEQVTNFRYTTLPQDSPYAKPLRMFYTQNGTEKDWDLLKVQDTVVIIILHKTRNTLVTVRQFRPAVYHAIITANSEEKELSPEELLIKYPAKLAVTTELCGGVVDKNKTIIEIAKEEVLEECGYDVPIERIELVMSYRSSTGMEGSMQWLYYTEVTDEDRVTTGGGIENEVIDVVELTLDECRNIVKQGATNNSPPSFLFGLTWFLVNKTSQ